MSLRHGVVQSFNQHRTFFIKDKPIKFYNKDSKKCNCYKIIMILTSIFLHFTVLWLSFAFKQCSDFIFNTNIILVLL